MGQRPTHDLRKSKHTARLALALRGAPPPRVDPLHHPINRPDPTEADAGRIRDAILTVTRVHVEDMIARRRDSVLWSVGSG
ncbi:hypothetical protein SGFS_091540 [Streptomyces graminofaciens]|uniref:Uncharacterized protein n=1 Tax=Streptomyces graminofaciens TaxID=68212 RepID=A0ABM7FJ40_9ACTN|nr:hypothetical protein SGFS_091540 [Streptomyces graminofaciens]